MRHLLQVKAHPTRRQLSPFERSQTVLSVVLASMCSIPTGDASLNKRARCSESPAQLAKPPFASTSSCVATTHAQVWIPTPSLLQPGVSRCQHANSFARRKDASTCDRGCRSRNVSAWEWLRPPSH